MILTGEEVHCRQLWKSDGGNVVYVAAVLDLQRTNYVIFHYHQNPWYSIEQKFIMPLEEFLDTHQLQEEPTMKTKTIDEHLDEIRGWVEETIEDGRGGDDHSALWADCARSYISANGVPSNTADAIMRRIYGE